MTSQSPATTRLHIAPLNPELLPLVLPASIRSLATDISFHSIATFPENNYGYVTLPTMEAEKIKKKLNGSILKGRKFKVDAARPQKWQRDEEDGQNLKSNDKSSSDKKSKKRKAADNVLDGYELPPDRQVKRGWTESTNDKTERRKKEKKVKSKDEKKAKSQSKSKYTEKAECLFRTKVPPNKLTSVSETSKKQAKKKNKSSQESVVHEFSQTVTHPTFLRSDDSGKSLISTFEEGKGWVDESGNVKENASERIRKEKYRPGQVAGHKEKASRVKVKSAHKVGHPREDKSRGHATGPEKSESTNESDDWTSSSGSLSSEEDSTDSESEDNVSEMSSEASDMDSPQEQQQTTPTLDTSGEEERDARTKSMALLKEDSTKIDREQWSSEVHPLEALFKKPALEKDVDSEPPAQFSFFGQEDAESEENTPRSIEPLTPFTKRDLQGRGLRSPAPTPDTSQVARTINWNPPEHSVALEEESSVHINSPVSKAGTGVREESDFTKWFWENRGDNNRAWKRRRREVAKEQRQRENRRKGMKGKS